MSDNKYGLQKLNKDMYKVGDCWVVNDKELGRIVFQPDLPYSEDVAKCMGMLLKDNPKKSLKVVYHLDSGWNTLGLELGTQNVKFGFFKPSLYWQHELFGKKVLSAKDMQELNKPDNWFQSVTTWVRDFMGKPRLVTNGGIKSKQVSLRVSPVTGCTSGEALMNVIEQVHRRLEHKEVGHSSSTITPKQLCSTKKLDVISHSQNPLSEIKVLPYKNHPIRQKLPESVLKVASTKGLWNISSRLKI